MDTFSWLKKLNTRPEVWSAYTAADLWTDPHIARQMLQFHLNEEVDLSSRRPRFIERSAAFMMQRFSLGAGMSVADFGCGPGLYTTRLAASGAAVTGIDFSENSLAHARELAAAQGVAVDHVQADYLEFETAKRFDLIIMIMTDFAVLSPDRRARLLARFRGLLNPGGAVLLDVGARPGFATREEGASYAPNLMDGFWSAEPYFGFLNTFKYDEAHVVLDRYTIVEAGRTRTIYNWFQYFDGEELAAEFTAAGFEVQEILGDVAGGAFDAQAAELAIIARS